MLYRVGRQVNEVDSRYSLRVNLSEWCWVCDQQQPTTTHDRQCSDDSCQQTKDDSSSQLQSIYVVQSAASRVENVQGRQKVATLRQTAASFRQRRLRMLNISTLLLNVAKMGDFQPQISHSLKKIPRRQAQCPTGSSIGVPDRRAWGAVAPLDLGN